MEKGFLAAIPFLTAADQATAIALKAPGAVLYEDGRGAENLDAAIASFRGRPGTLYIAGTLRVFGKSRAAMKDAVGKCHAAKIVIEDVDTGERSDRDGVEMLDRALLKIHGSAKVRNDRRFASCIGRNGGKKKLENARTRRMPEEAAGPIWGLQELDQETRLRLMSPPCYEQAWTAPTARRRLRHYRSQL